MGSLSTNVISLERREFELIIEAGMIVSSKVQKMFPNFLRIKGVAGRYGDNVCIFSIRIILWNNMGISYINAVRSKRQTRPDTFRRPIVSGKWYPLRKDVDCRIADLPLNTHSRYSHIYSFEVKYRKPIQLSWIDINGFIICSSWQTTVNFSFFRQKTCFHSSDRKRILLSGESLWVLSTGISWSGATLQEAWWSRRFTIENRRIPRHVWLIVLVVQVPLLLRPALLLRVTAEQCTPQGSRPRSHTTTYALNLWDRLNHKIFCRVYNRHVFFSLWKHRVTSGFFKLSDKTIKGRPGHDRPPSISLITGVAALSPPFWTITWIRCTWRKTNGGNARTLSELRNENLFFSHFRIFDLQFR